MSSSLWHRWLRHNPITIRSGRAVRPGRSGAHHKPRLEGLEERTLLSFSPPTFFSAGTGTTAVVAGDFTRDGILDLAMVNFTSNNLTLLTGNGSGGFANFGGTFPVGAGPSALAVADFGNSSNIAPDGKPDLVVVNSNASSGSNGYVNLLIGDGTGFNIFTGIPGGSINGAFGVGHRPVAVAVGDFKANGRMDVVVANQGFLDGIDKGNVTVLLRRNDGGFDATTFTDAAAANPVAVAVGDFNRDGNADIAVANDNGTVSIFLGNGDGTFASAKNILIGGLPGALAVADVNRDGIPDLVVADGLNSRVDVLLGNGDGTFKAAAHFAAGTDPISLTVGDFNGDGQLDLAVVNIGGGVSLLQGNGDGTFQAPVSFPAGSNAQAVAAGDFNRDGKLDLAVADFNSPNGGPPGGVSVLLNLAASTTFLDSNIDPSIAGQPVDFTAHVSPVAPASATPTGTVDFFDNGDAMGALTLSLGVVRFSGAVLAAGTHLITAVYSGDNAFTGSTGAPLIQTVLKPVPAITNVSPPSVAEGSAAFTLTVNGANYVNRTTVQFNGTPLVTTFVNGTQLTATVPAAAVTEEGASFVTVSNPGPGGGGSNGQALSVSDAALSATEVDVAVPQGAKAGNVVVATFTDAGGPEIIADYTATINWGDGTAPSAGAISLNGKTFTVTGTHTFANPGRFSMTTTILDDGGTTITSSSKAVVGSQNERFVTQAYLDLLGRTVDATGLAVWSAALDGGASLSQVAQGITSSQEYRTDLVETDYRLFLHRTADQGGLSSFLNLLGTGGTDEQMAAALTGSTEYFQNRGGSTNDGFLTALYQDALGRPADAGGRTAFDQQLAGGATRGQVAAEIFGSTEYRQDLVSSYYQRFLRRPADNGGLNAFVTALANGTKDEDIIAVLVGSGEYFARL